MNRFRSPIVAILTFLLTPQLPAVARPGLVPVHYHVSKSVSLGEPDRWDYVAFDPVSHRVYAAHGDRVTVVNSRSGAVVGSVVGMPGGTHGIAIVNATGRGYTDDGKAGIVAVFDLKTLKVVKRIKAESDADGVIFDPPSGHVFVIDGDSGKLTVIDPNTDSVIATVDGGGGLEFGDRATTASSMSTAPKTTKSCASTQPRTRLMPTGRCQVVLSRVVSRSIERTIVCSRVARTRSWWS